MILIINEALAIAAPARIGSVKLGAAAARVDLGLEYRRRLTRLDFVRHFAHIPRPSTRVARPSPSGCWNQGYG
jgi:hypothetical protein